MENKVRNIDQSVVKKLNQLAKSFEISREELLRQILEDYTEKQSLKENPLFDLLEEHKKVLFDVKSVLLSVDRKIDKL